MTTTTEPTGPQERYEPRDRDYRDRDYRDDDRARRERGIFISTEARPGILTSEFWLTLLGVGALIILAFAVDELGDRFGVACATAVLVGYILSRGIAKAGSSDTKRRRVDV